MSNMEAQERTIVAAVARKNSMEYEDHIGMLKRLSNAGYGRLMRAGVVVEWEDVFQEMSMYWMRAKNLFDPQAGVGFSAYFGRACWNNFNKYAERLINEQMGLGLLRECDMGSGEAGQEGFLASIEGSHSEGTPEDIVSQKEQTGRKLRNLSPQAKRMVREIINESEGLRLALELHNGAAESGLSGRRVTDATFGFIGRHLNMTPVQIRECKTELAEVFEVSL